jgi:hypothetical protein
MEKLQEIPFRQYEVADLDTPDEIREEMQLLREQVREHNRKIIELEQVVEGCLSAPKKAKKGKRTKGFAMKNVLMSIAVLAIIGGLVFTVAQAAYVRGDINYEIASNPEMLAEYLEDVLAGATYWRFTPQASAPSGSDLQEGVVYYNDTTNALYVSTDGSTFTALESAAGNSLDAAYNAGQKITVDSAVIEFEVADSLGAAALLLDYDDATTNAMDVLQITNAGDDAAAVSIQIDGTAGYDIQGTGDTWNISIAGAASFVGVTNTTGDVLFDDTYDLFWDTSKDLLLVNDNAELGFGGASGDDPDVGIIWNASNLLIESKAEDTGELTLFYMAIRTQAKWHLTPVRQRRSSTVTTFRSWTTTSWPSATRTNL